MFDARLSATLQGPAADANTAAGDFVPEGSEQQGYRPVVVVSRDAINRSSPVILIVPCTTHRPEKRIYPTHVLIQSPEGGLTANSVALCEQVRPLGLDKLSARRGRLRPPTIDAIDQALRIALDLDP